MVTGAWLSKQRASSGAGGSLLGCRQAICVLWAVTDTCPVPITGVGKGAMTNLDERDDEVGALALHIRQHTLELVEDDCPVAAVD